jgi:hypothetical protein
MSEVAFRKNQYGKETIKGTAVAATRRFQGTVKLPQDRKWEYPPDVLGLRAQANRGMLYQVSADPVTMSMEHGYFQALPMWCSTFFKGGVTPTETTGGQGDYKWTFDPSITASNAQDSVTLQTGNDTQAFQIEYLMGRKFKLAGSFGQNQPVTGEWEGFGKQVTPITFTAAINPFSTTGMAANLGQVYIDALWANKGTTKKTGLFRSFDLDFANNLHPKWNGDALSMTSHGEGMIDFIATFVMEHTAAAQTEWTNFRAGTPFALKVSLQGPQIGTGTPHQFNVCSWGMWEDIRPLDSEDNGDDLVAAIFHGITDNTNYLTVDATTNLQTM